MVKSLLGFLGALTTALTALTDLTKKHRTTNAERRTSNLPEPPDISPFTVRCSLLGVRCSCLLPEQSRAKKIYFFSPVYPVQARSIRNQAEQGETDLER